ncbi:MAG: 4Fe-4S double cluster binding domain-containing protein [Chloroflexota bacterium]|nr:4Fe-4S double cluster binding domain-containing protein [Chloroflexota bacterium]
MSISDQLTDWLRSQGAAWVGFADLGEVSEGSRHGLPVGVSIALALDPVIVAQIENGPTRDYEDEYRRVNAQLNSLAASAVSLLEAADCSAVPIASTTHSIDYNTYSTLLPHKTIATRAGFGWIGKCALLVTESFGSAVRLVSVLTDASLPTALPIHIFRCGDCVACVEVCPGQAPSGKHWQVEIPRDTFFNASGCFTAATEAATSKAGVMHPLCGMCIAVCPWTKRYIERAQP